jgi:hypothetical protein
MITKARMRFVSVFGSSFNLILFGICFMADQGKLDGFGTLGTPQALPSSIERSGRAKFCRDDRRLHL